ncbi:MAG: hypothetical protein AAFP09_03405 [Cyanobacteria bacterium J06607_10]
MTKSTFLRYLPARLKPFGNPAVWAPLAVFTLLSVFIWEWRKNPDWFNRQPVTTINPASNLTPEERARLSEMGNLDALIEGSGVSGDADTVTSQISPGSPVLPEGEEGEATLAGEGTSFENPFTQYENEYRFGGAANPAAALGSAGSTIIPSDAIAPTSSANNAAGNRRTNSSARPTFDFGDGLVNPAAPNTNSVLSEALNRQLTTGSSLQGNPATSTQASDANNGSSSATVNPPRSSRSSGNAINLPVAPPAAQSPGSAIPNTFIPTTPDMSPPVGSTGYQAPASSSLPAFNQAPPQATQNPFNRVRAQQQPTSSGNATPNTRATPIPNGSSQSETLYTAPAFTQPDQGRAINPRR